MSKKPNGKFSPEHLLGVADRLIADIERFREEATGALENIDGVLMSLKMTIDHLRPSERSENRPKP